MTDNAGIKTKRGRVRKHSLGEVLYYAFVVPQPDGPRRMVRKARVPRVYKCAHIRDIRSGCGRKQRKKSHIRGRPQQTWYCGWLRMSLTRDRDGSFAFIDQKGTFYDTDTTQRSVLLLRRIIQTNQ